MLRTSRSKFTTRRFMIVVAVATILVVSGAKARRFLELREGYLGAADYHAEREQEERQKLSNIDLARKNGLGSSPLVPIVEDLAAPAWATMPT